MKKILQALALLVLSGCGVAYISPSVRQEASGAKVRVIPMTMQSVLRANQSHYTPKRMPQIFAQTTGRVALQTPGRVPDAVFTKQRRPGPVETRLPPDAPDKPYRIGVGDVLVLATPQADATLAGIPGLIAAQNKRQGYTVQDDGAISVPDVGRIPVAGMTLDSAEAEVFKALVKNQINPSFSLEIAEFHSQYIVVGGAVKDPTIIPITIRPIYLDEALQLAGGATAISPDYVTIRLFRDGHIYQMPLSKFYAKRRLQKIRLMDQDSIFVDTTYNLTLAKSYFDQQLALRKLKQSDRAAALAQMQAELRLQSSKLSVAQTNFNARLALDAVPRDYVYLAGEVAKQSRYTLPFGRKATLADALFSEGGIPTRSGNPGQIYVLRGARDPADFAAITAYHLDASNAVNLLLATRFELRPSDVVFVAEQPVTRWNRAISQIGPFVIQKAFSATGN